MSTRKVELIHIRLKSELERLGMKPAAAAKAAGEPDSQGLRDVLGGRKRLSAELLAALSVAGVDVAYVLTGVRQQSELSDVAIHQAVLDAVDLLSLEKKVDAQQLAKAVVKLCQRAAPVSGSGQPAGQTQTIQKNSGILTQSGTVHVGSFGSEEGKDK